MRRTLIARKRPVGCFFFFTYLCLQATRWMCAVFKKATRVALQRRKTVIHLPTTTSGTLNSRVTLMTLVHHNPRSADVCGSGQIVPHWAHLCVRWLASCYLYPLCSWCTSGGKRVACGKRGANVVRWNWGSIRRFKYLCVFTRAFEIGSEENG